MTFRSTCFFFVLLTFIVGVYSCKQETPQDPCCSFTDLPATADVKNGQGVLQVEGSTTAYFYVLDELGTQVAYQSLNQSLPLDPGRYKVRVNNVIHTVEVLSGMLAKCSTG